MEAILRQVEINAVAGFGSQGKTVAQALVEASRAEGALDDIEAMQLEAFIAARRQPHIAAAIAENRRRWRTTIVQPLRAARHRRRLRACPDADFDSVVYFLETLQLGLLVQRGAGQPAPDVDVWQRFLRPPDPQHGRPAPAVDVTSGYAIWLARYEDWISSTRCSAPPTCR